MGICSEIAMSQDTSPSAFNDWFLSLPEGRQDILKDDKWMMAEAAFRQGVEVGIKNAEYTYIAQRHADGSPWSGKFFSLDKGVYAHCEGAELALQASSAASIKEAIYATFCTGSSPRLTGQALGHYSILRGRGGIFDDVVEKDFVPAFAFGDMFEEPVCRLFGQIVQSLPGNGRFIADPHYDISQNLAHYWALLCCASRILRFELPHADDDILFEEQDYLTAIHALQGVNRDYWKEAHLREHSEVHFANIALMVRQTARKAGMRLERFPHPQA
jgi:hypothetical protein